MLACRTAWFNCARAQQLTENSPADTQGNIGGWQHCTVVNYHYAQHCKCNLRACFDFFYPAFHVWHLNK